MTTLAKNKKAYHDYEILEKYEAGVELYGTEVKSCRARNISLVDGHARVENGELWLTGVHIAPYKQGNIQNHDPRRNRRLLMHKRQIRALEQATQAKGMTVVPVRMYLKGGRVKAELALCRGKAKHDKREAMKSKLHQKEAEAAMARHR